MASLSRSIVVVRLGNSERPSCFDRCSHTCEGLSASAKRLKSSPVPPEVTLENAANSKNQTPRLKPNQIFKVLSSQIHVHLSTRSARGELMLLRFSVGIKRIVWPGRRGRYRAPATRPSRVTVPSSREIGASAHCFWCINCRVRQAGGHRMGLLCARVLPNPMTTIWPCAEGKSLLMPNGTRSSLNRTCSTASNPVSRPTAHYVTSLRALCVETDSAKGPIDTSSP